MKRADRHNLSLPPVRLHCVFCGNIILRSRLEMSREKFTMAHCPKCHRAYALTDKDKPPYPTTR